MKLSELKNIKKLYFGYEELARAFGISVASARVTASRYVSKGLLVRIKRNVYVLREVWKTATKEDRFVMANLGQVPSYLSLMTALDYYGITTQMQRDFFESVAIQRTKTLQVDSSDSMKMLTHISKQLKRYKKQFPVFSALKKRGMAARHWKSLSQRLSLDLDESVTQTSPL